MNEVKLNCTPRCARFVRGVFRSAHGGVAIIAELRIIRRCSHLSIAGVLWGASGQDGNASHYVRFECITRRGVDCMDKYSNLFKLRQIRGMKLDSQRVD